MINLDSLLQIEKLDKSHVLASIEKLPNQIEQVMREFESVEIPSDYKNVRNIVLAGMGGSALPGRVVDCLLFDNLRVPFEIFTEFGVPSYVNENTLVILSSYSGNTAETIAAGKDALKKRARIFGIATGGELAAFLKKEKLPGYIFEPYENVSNQPRMSLGYSISALLMLFDKCGLANVSGKELGLALNKLRGFVWEHSPSVDSGRNLAKKIARDLKGRMPIFVASEHLTGSTHVFKNQLNENAKVFAVTFDIPELNHHLMEGLRNPAQAKEYFKFVFFESDLYASEVKKRYKLTQEVVEKNEIATIVYEMTGKTKIEQVFELLALSSYVSFYLALLYDIDPGPIPWVDYFKSKL